MAAEGAALQAAEDAPLWAEPRVLLGDLDRTAGQSRGGAQDTVRRSASVTRRFATERAERARASLASVEASLAAGEGGRQ